MAKIGRPTFSSLLETGVVYCDDNLHRLPLLPPNSVDLIYLDPPFFSNRSYEVIWGDEAEVRSFGDRWEGGIQHYVGWMKDRALEMWRVLKPTGSLYLHCDWHASHYLKVMLDEVFGYGRFRNEIVWKRAQTVKGNFGQGSKLWGQATDSLLFYSKGDAYTFNQPFTAYSEEYAEKGYRHLEEGTGRRYQLVSMTGPGGAAKGNPAYEVMGVTRYWRYSRETMQHLIDAGMVVQPKHGGVPRRKYYLDEGKGVPVQSLWDDVRALHASDAERLGYPTQKPEALLERIISASSNPGDVVLDPFAGCGTATVVAHRLRRRWVGIDISPTACNLMKRRLAKVGAGVKLVGMPTRLDDLKSLKPFEFQNWIIDRINGVQSPRKSGDMGIDGWTFLLHDPVQIKQSERVGRNVIDNFETAVKRANKARGFVAAFSFTRDAREEVARARRDGLEIHLVTVDDLLARPETVFRLMGIATGLPGLDALPMPQFDASRLSADDLVLSDMAAG